MKKFLSILVLTVATVGLQAACAFGAYGVLGSFAGGGPDAGGSGAGDGELSSPAAVDVRASTGRVYVADTANNRVEVFGPTVTGAVYESQVAITAPTGLAIDQADGTVYVSDGATVHKYDQNLAPAIGWTAPAASGALAVDPSSHEVLVADLGANLIRRYQSDGTAAGGFASARPLDVAVDSSGDVVVVESTGDLPSDCSASSVVRRFSGTGVDEGTIGSPTAASAVAIDPDDDGVVIAAQTNGYNCGGPLPQIQLYDDAGVAGLSVDLGPETLYATVAGLAAQGAGSTRIYAVTRSPFNDIYGATAITIVKDLTPPILSTIVADGIEQRGAVLHGTVDTRNLDTTHHFEYRITGTTTWTSTPDNTDSGSAVGVSVQGDVSGLDPKTTYELRLVATNAEGSATSAATTFTTLPGPPTVTTAGASQVTDTSAWLQAAINPHNNATTYYFEYGQTTAYGGAVPLLRDASAGVGGISITVSKPVDGLTPSTTYHYRIVAHNASGTNEGEDHTFTTTALVANTCANVLVRAQQHAQGVPDCRAWEQVSPANKFGYAIGKNVQPNIHLGVAADGDRVTYDSTFPLAGADAGDWSGLLGERTAETWLTTALLRFHGQDVFGGGNPSATDTLLRGTTPDQRTSVYWDCTSEPYGALWVRRADGTSVRIADATAFPLVPACYGSGDGQPWFLGISPDGRHVIFNSTSRLGPAAGLPGSGRILYEWVDDGSNSGAGALRVVNRTNDESLALLDPGNASLGGGRDVAGSSGASDQPQGMRNAISDGSDGETRIFFQNPAPTDVSAGGGSLFMRTSGNSTVKVSAAAPGYTPASPTTPTGVKYIDAARDGSRVYFVADGDLTSGAPPTGGIYRYDVGTAGGGSAGAHLTWLTPAPSGGETSGMTNVDASRLYYQSGPDEIHLLDGNTDRLIFRGLITANFVNNNGTFGFEPGLRSVYCPSANVTPDGRYLAFGAYTLTAGLQVYRYDADANAGAGQVEHVSTGPNAPATYDAAFSGFCAAGDGRPVEKRVMSDDGQYIFFDTAAALVSGDSNGPNVLDAYQWHDGKTELISKGSGPSPSSFVGTDSSGKNAFFVTADALALQDRDAAYDIYDARIDGGFKVEEPSRCVDEGCQPPPTVSGGAETPASSTFSGSGNEPPAVRRRKLSVGAIGTAALRKAAKSGVLTVSVRTGDAGTIDATAFARLQRSTTRVASAKKRVRSASTARLALKLTRAARKELARAGRLSVTLDIRFSTLPGATVKRLVLTAPKSKSKTSKGR